MTNGIGNPDWQRRYVVSAAPIATGTFLDDTNRVIGPLDTNGYQYLLVTTNDPGATTFKHVKIDWFQDQAGTLAMGDTDWTIPPSSFIVIKTPVIARWYKVEIGPVGGATGHNTQLTVYGTNADQENLLTQNTAVPMGGDRTSVAAAGVHTVQLGGTFGGRVSVNMDDDGNNKWTLYMEYYDWTVSAWVQFMTWHGADKGQSFTGDVMLPYAPIRMNVRNDDTVAHFLTWSVIAP
jgi:hypothetical protein